MELEKVLAGVRAGSPFSGDDEPEHFNPDAEGEDGDRRASTTTYPTIVDLPGPSGASMTTSEAAGQQEDPDIDSVMSFPHMTPKKGPGYFDLHPERRPGGARPMPGGGRTMSNASEYSVGDTSALGDGRRSTDSDTPTVGLPEFGDADIVRGSQENAHARAESTTLPGLVIPAAPEKRSISPGTGGDAKSKTSALIEMYRERERSSASSPSGNVLPSKLLVWSSSLANGGAKDKDVPPLPAPIPSRGPAIMQGGNSLHPNHAHAPEASEGDMESVTSGELEATDLDAHADCIAPPDREALFGADGTVVGGRESPMRYVHGVPLHNVLEEEEEEEV